MIDQNLILVSQIITHPKKTPVSAGKAYPKKRERETPQREDIYKSLLLHIPHSSSKIPNDLREQFLLDEKELEEELLKMTDWYTDELFGTKLFSQFIFPVSRIVCDPERFSDDEIEPMAKLGMGMVYTKTATGKPLRRELSQEERNHLKHTYYQNHQDSMQYQTNMAMAEKGMVLILDCHSFPSHPLPCDQDQQYPRPDICIGVDSYHTPKILEDLAIYFFSGIGYKTTVNEPYAGSFVPIKNYQQTKRVQSIMIEVNRSLYMNEITGMKNQNFIKVREHLHGFQRILQFYLENQIMKILFH